jgi:hypothetical protein
MLPIRPLRGFDSLARAVLGTVNSERTFEHDGGEEIVFLKLSSGRERSPARGNGKECNAWGLYWLKGELS